MKFVILGSGAMGCLWGSYLALHDHSVHMLHHRQSFVDRVREQGGIRMKRQECSQMGPDGEQGDPPPEMTLAPVHASTDYETPFRAEGGHIDCIIIMLKSFQTAEAMARMKPILDKYGTMDGPVVCTLQNGIGNVEAIMEAGGVPADQVLFGTTVTFSSMCEDGTIEDFEHRRPTNIWTAGNAEQLSTKQQQVIDCLRFCGFQINATPDALKMLWSKLAVNCAINTVTAICRLKIGQSWSYDGDLKKPTTGRDLMLQVAAEVASVARAEGINLSDEEAQKTVANVAQGSANHVASMCRDVLNKRKTEVDNLNGQVMHYAQNNGINVPTTASLFMLVKLIESNYDSV